MSCNFVNLCIQTESGCIHICYTENSLGILKATWKTLAVANLFLHLWFQPLVDDCHSEWWKLCVIGSSLTCGIRVTRFMQKSTQTSSGRPLQPGTHVHCHSPRHQPALSSVFIQKRTCSVQFSCTAAYCRQLAHCIHQIFPCNPFVLCSTSR